MYKTIKLSIIATSILLLLICQASAVVINIDGSQLQTNITSGAANQFYSWNKTMQYIDFSMIIGTAPSGFNSTYDNTTNQVNANLQNWNDTTNNSYILKTSESSLNVNSSSYWDGLLHPSNIGTSGFYLTSVGDGNTTWTNLPPAGSSISYFFHNYSASGNLSYSSLSMNRTLNISLPRAYKNVSMITGTPIFIGNWTTDPMGVNFIPFGIHEVHTDAIKIGGSGAHLVRLYYECRIVNETGTILTFNGTSDYSPEILSTVTEADMDLLMGDMNVNTTDRMLVTLYAIETGGGAEPTVSVMFSDRTDSRLILPGTQIDLTPMVNNISVLQSEMPTKEPLITGSTLDKFLNGLKQFVSINSSTITDFVSAVRTNLSAGINLSYNSATGTFDDIRTDYKNTTVNTVNRTDFALEYVFDNDGTVIPANKNFWLVTPFYANIYEIHVTSDIATNAVINVSKASAPTSGALPSFTDITGGNQIVLTNQGSLTDSTLTGWTKNITNDDLIKINIFSVNNATKLIISLDARKQ